MSLNFNTSATDTDVNDARLAGFQAARRGDCYRLCPHPFRTAIRAAWLDGWQLGKKPKPQTPAVHNFNSVIS